MGAYAYILGVPEVLTILHTQGSAALLKKNPEPFEWQSLDMWPLNLEMILKCCQVFMFLISLALVGHLML